MLAEIVPGVPDAVFGPLGTLVVAIAFGLGVARLYLAGVRERLAAEIARAQRAERRADEAIAGWREQAAATRELQDILERSPTRARRRTT